MTRKLEFLGLSVYAWIQASLSSFRSRRAVQRARPNRHMVFMFSPHRDSGGTLHVPSPTSTPRSNPPSTLEQLRRSLSRSPSKGPAFRLITSKSNSPSPNSPLSPSPLSPSRQGGLLAAESPISAHEPAPLGSPFHSGSKKKRSIVRHLSPMRPSSRTFGIQRSPAKRTLADSSDNGNATPRSSMSSGGGSENDKQFRETNVEKQGYSIFAAVSAPQEPGSRLAPHHALGRRDKPTGYFDIAKSSPLKRSEGSTNLDLAHLGTPAKRRSLHGASFGADFNIFDQVAAFEQTDTSTQTHQNISSDQEARDLIATFTPLPHRSASLRKTTLQQRFEKPATERGHYGAHNLFDARTPATPEMKARSRLSLEFPVPQVGRESPFTNDGLQNASIHHAPLMRRELSGPGGPPVSSRHPLARTISQSSSSSGLAQDSPTHIPARHPEPRRPKGDLSRSLPLGSLRPSARDNGTAANLSEGSSFATPDNYKLAKPLPAAFMSTGLISKRNKNIDHEALELGESVGNMPDTPCKRPTSLTSMVPEPTPDIKLNKSRQNRHSMHSFGTPSTPFNPHVQNAPVKNTTGLSIFGSSFNNGGMARKGSFPASDLEDALKSPLATFQKRHSRCFEKLPAPTRQVSDSSLSSANCPSPDNLQNTRSCFPDDSVMESPKAAFNCKSIPISTPAVTKERKGNGHGESPSSNMLRFRSFSSISSFSKRPHATGRSHCPTPLSGTPLPLPLIPRQNENAKQSSLIIASPTFERHERNSPRTPLDTMMPPDPSGLSISAQAEKINNTQYSPANSNSSFAVPATPTAIRDSFGRFSKFGSSTTPVHHAVSSDIDASITSRFDKVEPLRSGEFSQVFRTSRRAAPVAQQGYFAASQVKRSPKAPLSEQVWAVKKTNRAYLGPRDRLRKLQEVEVLRALGQGDHTINYIDSWECDGHLYIQTEFCEEGALDSFLERAGQRARLDDFRIWKIMLEISLVRISVLYALAFP